MNLRRFHVNFNEIYTPHISFFITSMCNWNCYYCDIPKITNQKSTTLTILQKHSYIFEYINKLKCPVSLTGGELGLVPTNVIDYLFGHFDVPLLIPTNGTFIKNGMFDHYKDHIYKLVYHVSIDLEQRDWTFINENDVDILDYVVILTHSNIMLFEEFLRHFPFKLNPKLSRVKEKNVFNNVHLTHADLLELRKIAIKYEHKLNSNFIHNIEWQLTKKKNIESLAKLCKNACLLPQIDLVDEQILACCTSYDDNTKIKLNEDNFLSSICGDNNKLFNDTLSIACETCNRVDLLSDISNVLLKKYQRNKMYGKLCQNKS